MSIFAILLLSTFVYITCAEFRISGVPDIEDYRAYLLEHGKPMDRLESRERFEAFKRAAEYVAAHSADSYKVGINELADWLPSEIPGSAITSSYHHSSSFCICCPNP